jgi:SAM-dependent methyltransferase
MKYEEVFRHRGESYDLAMKKYPDARDLEFKQIFHKLPLKENEKILDIPALGGYLKKYCLDSNDIVFLDFSKSINGINVVSPYEEWPIETVDRIVCLASIHHIEHFELFLNNMKKHLKPSGIIHLADVSVDSPISKFLDEFVGSKTSTGTHKGTYYDWKKVVFPKDLNVIEIETRNCPWIFNSEQEMSEYCRLLFDLRNVTDKEILDELENYIGFEKKHNKIYLEWSLTYIDLILN